MKLTQDELLSNFKSEQFLRVWSCQIYALASDCIRNGKIGKRENLKVKCQIKYLKNMIAFFAHLFRSFLPLGKFQE